MKQRNLESKLKKIIKNLNLVHEVEKIPVTENLFTMGALDSLILVQYVLAIEDELKISIPNTDINYENFKTFENQIRYFEPLLASKKAS